MPSWVVGSCRAAYPPLTRYIAPQQRIWVVYGRTGQATMAGEDVYLQSSLAFGDPVSKARFGKDIVAMRFELGRISSANQQD